MHLTNYSLNKNSEDFVQTEASNTGSKRTMTSVEEVKTPVKSNCAQKQMQKLKVNIMEDTVL